jgi:ribonuclease HII
MLDARFDAAFPMPLAGTDEVGRGCLAGAVVAAAVILPADFPEHIRCQLNDSKKIPQKKRALLAEAIKKHALYAVSVVDVATIDRINILRASLLAMQQAVLALPLKPALVLVDGNKAPHLPYPVQTVIGGDGLSGAIAAASIVAKVHRDALMMELDKKYPGYGWAENAGYGTALHRMALHERGITPHHRKTFAPVKALLAA